MSTLDLPSGPATDGVIQWLLDGDLAVRWQVLQDLVGAAEGRVERERRKVARHGWGARLLARHDPEGTWAGGLSSDGGLYSPKWISTTYTMMTLRDFGLPATNRQARKARRLLLGRGFQNDGRINYGIWAQMDRSERDLRHRDGPFHPLLFRVRRCPSRYHCRPPAGATDARWGVELSAPTRRNPRFGPYDYQRARGLAILRIAP